MATNTNKLNATISTYGMRIDGYMYLTDFRITTRKTK